MKKYLSALLMGVSVVAVVQAHALYLVPTSDAASQVVVVFGHTLKPDPAVKEKTWNRFDGLKLSARDAEGKVTSVQPVKKADHLLANVPSGTVLVFGQVDAGLYAKGDAVPKVSMYYPKAIIGAIPSDGGVLGTSAVIEIVPKVEAGKVRFRVLTHGKPLAAAKVSVMVPSKEEEAETTTDETGWTSAFEAKGHYGVTCRHIEAKTGERNGEKYDGITHTATLVVNVK